MSLREARTPDGKRVTIEGPGPYPASELIEWVGEEIVLPCLDPWVQDTGTKAHAYLDGARKGWEEYPEWMDFLDLDSPCNALKRAERDLYLHAWKPWLDAKTVLDVGCGIGRFVAPFLDRGADVWGVDADLTSLQRCLWHSAGRLGRLDLCWSSVHRLPDLPAVDVAVCAEVLCYVPDVERAMEAIVARLKSGGALLLSVEARYGWAASEDAPPGTLDAALSGTGIVDVTGDRWVRTYERDEVVALLENAGLTVERLLPTHYMTDGPLERIMPEDVSLEQLLEAEERCRLHPVWSPLNRAWTAVGIKS